MPAATTCSCSIDGAFSRNGAWVAQNNPGGDARFAADAACARAGDPLAVSLASGNSFSPATYAALWFTAPPQTTITDYKVAVHHYWYAPGPPDETTYELVSFGPTFFSGAGQFYRKDWHEPLAIERHWYGWVGDVPNGPVDATDTGIITRTLSDSKIALGQGSATYMTVSAGC